MYDIVQFNSVLEHIRYRYTVYQYAIQASIHATAIMFLPPSDHLLAAAMLLLCPQSPTCQGGVPHPLGQSGDVELRGHLSVSASSLAL